jgi:hypothetical protein
MCGELKGLNVRKVKLLDNYLEFLHNLYLKEMPLAKRHVDLLHEHGFIKYVRVPEFKPITHRATEKPYVYKTDHEKEIDASVDVVFTDEMSTHTTLVKEVDDVMSLENEVMSVQGGRVIEKEDWIPHNGSVLEPEPEFVTWIDSAIRGYSHAVKYEKFERYKQQAADWLAENKTSSDCANREELIDFVIDERNKFAENSLYFVNKYLNIKQKTDDGSVLKFTAWDCQAFIAYLIDCGFSIGVGKLRQVGGSTLIGGIALCKMVAFPNIFIKFIAENGTKAEEIFRDKIKWAFYELPDYLRPTVANDREEILRFAPKKAKGKGRRTDSILTVEPPYLTAINGGTPDMVLVDEIGQIKILGDMTGEGRPTLFRVDEKTGKLVMTRQVIMWGTGGEMDRGGSAMRTEYNVWVDDWKQRNFRGAIVPIFLDAFSKPSVDKNFYELEKAAYYKKGQKVQFHQHYPITPEDMFLTSHKTIVPIDVINDNVQIIIDRGAEAQGRWGFFDPIYDYSIKLPEYSDVPHPVIGAKFIEVEDEAHDHAWVQIIHEPDNAWDWRYYQGTDPVNATSGSSLMASSIWDEKIKGLAAMMNFRISNYKVCYKQTVLLNLFYGKPPHLIEANRGTNLIDYVYEKGLYDTLITNAMLPDYLQVASQNLMGIHLSTAVKPRFIHVLITMIDTYGPNLGTMMFWTQLKTFVEKTTDAGNVKWQPQNLKIYNDDVIDAAGLSYTARTCYMDKVPVRRNALSVSKKITRKLVYNPSTGTNELIQVMK